MKFDLLVMHIRLWVIFPQIPFVWFWSCLLLFRCLPEAYQWWDMIKASSSFCVTCRLGNNNNNRHIHAIIPDGHKLNCCSTDEQIHFQNPPNRPTSTKNYFTADAQKTTVKLISHDSFYLPTLHHINSQRFNNFFTSNFKRSNFIFFILFVLSFHITPAVSRPTQLLQRQMNNHNSITSEKYEDLFYRYLRSLNSINFTIYSSNVTIDNSLHRRSVEGLNNDSSHATKHINNLERPHWSSSESSVARPLSQSEESIGEATGTTDQMKKKYGE